MRRNLMILGFVVMVCLIYTSDVRSGGMACADCYTHFRGPAFSATVVLNPDSVNASNMISGLDCPGGMSCPYQGTVAITLSRGHKSSAAIFVSPVVVQFGNGCDGKLGAFYPDPTYIGVAAKTDVRFIGLAEWIPDDVLAQLLAPFGITPDPNHPLVFSDIDHAVCTPNPNQILGSGVYYTLSFDGTMQFGVIKTKKK